MSEHLPMEQMEVFKIFEDVADWAWASVSSWSRFAQDVVGRQLVTAADSVNANLVEGDGRYSDPDAVRFFVIARASARETRLWIRRSIKRNLVDEGDGLRRIEMVNQGTRLLNNLISYRRMSGKPQKVKEAPVMYSTPAESDDPFNSVES